MHLYTLHNLANSSRQQKHSRRAGAQMIGSCAPSGKRCRVSGPRQEVIALFSWRAMPAMSHYCQRAPVVFLGRRLAMREPRTPPNLPLLVRGPLLCRFELALVKANYLDGGPSRIHSPGTGPVAGRSALRKSPPDHHRLILNPTKNWCLMNKSWKIE